MIGTRLRMCGRSATVSLGALPAGVGGIMIMRASDNTQIGSTLTAVGQSLTVPAGIQIYAKSSQPLPWDADWPGEYYTGYRLTLTGATEGRQSIDKASDEYLQGHQTNGSLVCQTGNVTSAGTMAVGIYLESGNG